LSQKYDENRTLETTLALSWAQLSLLPESELTRIADKYVKMYYKK
jgi:V/A-type H+-transporting ATPase subunit B